MMLHSIDLHKRVLQMASMRADGSAVLREARLPATEQALGPYLNNWPGFRHRLVCETTGSWYWVADYLRSRGRAELKLAHAAKVEAITAAKVKTDGVCGRRTSTWRAHGYARNWRASSSTCSPTVSSTTTPSAACP